MKKVVIDKCEVYVPSKMSKEASAVIVIGGSSGGLNSNDQAIFFAKNGYPSAVIPYYSLEDLPKELKRIPLEYFTTAIKKIRSHEFLQNRKCFIQGTSRGAEVSLLLCAKELVKIDGLILISPTAYVWPGPNSEENLRKGEAVEVSTWTLGGKDVEFVKFDPINYIPPERKKIDGIDYLIFKNTWHSRAKGDHGRIDLSNFNSNLLVFSGRDDQLWPSYDSAINIINSIQRSENDVLLKHVSFDKVGHNIPFPGKEPRINAKHSTMDINILYGGDKDATQKASEVWWAEVKNFIDGPT